MADLWMAEDVEPREVQFGIELPSGRVVGYRTEAFARHQSEQLELPLRRRWVGPWLPVGDTEEPT